MKKINAMRILYFHQYFNTPKDAGGTRSYEMAQKLLQRGHKVTMVCIAHGKSKLNLPGDPSQPLRRGNIDGIDVIQFNLAYSNHMSLPKRALIFLKYAFKSIGVALRADYDLVFATSTPLTVGIPGIFARWLRGKPFVFEVRDLWPELPREMGVVKNPLVLAGMSLLEWLSYRASNACIALSPGIKRGIQRRSREGHPVAMIPNGSDLELFRPGRRENLEMPEVKKNDCTAVFTGAHGMANGLDAVLDAALELKKRGRADIKFLFIGDGKLKPDLKARAESEGLKSCLFYDPIPKNELAKVLGCCDIGLMILDDVPAFYYGTSPNKFFDYISAGLPVLNNYPGWLADLITENECGIAVPPRDPVAFADAMCELTDNPDLRKNYGRNARALAESEFSREKLAEEFVDWLEKVAGNNKKMVTVCPRMK